MADVIADQSAPVITGAEEAVSEALTSVVAETVEPVAGDVGTVPASQVSFDFGSDDGIRAAIEANPNLAGYLQRQQADAANTARQRRDAELRREQGTVENATAYHRWLAEQYQNGADLEQIGRQTPLYVKANQDTTRVEYARNFLQGAADAGDETAKGLLETLTGDPEEAVRVAQIALNSMVTRARSEERAAAEAEIEAKWQAKYEADKAADTLEAQIATRSNPPNVAGAAPGSLGMTTQTAMSMTADQAARLSDDAFAEWKKLRMATA